jgi:hypothetical protein
MPPMPHLSRRGALIVARMDELRLGPLPRLAVRARIRPRRLVAVCGGADWQAAELSNVARVLRLDVRELVQP